MQKPQASASGKVEESGVVSSKPSSSIVRSDESQISRSGPVKATEEGGTRSRLGSGNAGQGYNFEEVRLVCLLLH